MKGKGEKMQNYCTDCGSKLDEQGRCPNCGKSYSVEQFEQTIIYKNGPDHEEVVRIQANRQKTFMKNLLMVVLICLIFYCLFTFSRVTVPVIVKLFMTIPVLLLFALCMQTILRSIIHRDTLSMLISFVMAVMFIPFFNMSSTVITIVFILIVLAAAFVLLMINREQ